MSLRKRALSFGIADSWVSVFGTMADLHLGLLPTSFRQGMGMALNFLPVAIPFAL